MLDKQKLPPSGCNRPPSGRDFEVFSAVIVAGKATREAAGEFKLSQTRVCQIVERVKKWQAEVVDAELVGEEKRLYLAKCIAAGRLDHLYGEAMEAWRRSQGQLKKTRSSRFGDEVTTATVSCGDPKYLMAAMRLATAQAELPAAGWSLFPVEEEEELGRPDARPTGDHPEVDCSADGDSRADSATAATAPSNVNIASQITSDDSYSRTNLARRELFGPVQPPQRASEVGVVTTLQVGREVPGISVQKKRELTRQQRRRLKRMQQAG
jgi:hypothetical protein